MHRIIPIFLAFVCTLGWQGCTEPVKPDFALGDAFYLVEGSIIAEGGESEVRLRKSNFREVNFQFQPVTDALIQSLEVDGQSVIWSVVDAEAGSYRPPAGFRAEPGQTWHFEITFADGTQGVSTPETIPEPVPLDSLTVNFVQNSAFDTGLDRFIPRFELFVNYKDPAGVPNYYEWQVGFWKKINVCASCLQGIWRNGECIAVNDRFVFRYDYPCNPPNCYQYEVLDQVLVSYDALSDGQYINGFPVGAIPFDGYGSQLAVARAVSLTPDAYAYVDVISKLVNGQDGLNGTIPVALNGNVRNQDPDGTLILGYLRGVSTTEVTAYYERTINTGFPLPFDSVLRLEDPLGRLRAPCDGPNRITSPPPGWP
ncbi:DUF4249 domain-containing protein [Neolewinella persica]|uniref:DUF4249 domain-containing protein n=1 Tax=Neolewinella persica TaxID=70998 RepID=UPI0004766492|nr:DUF4249 domain-containing protein [Neolewinella persica]